jgi:hypothetical protein
MEPLVSQPLAGADRLAWINAHAGEDAALTRHRRTDAERGETLQGVVCNRRSLILPTMRVAHRASLVPGQLTRRIGRTVTATSRSGRALN